MKTKQMGLQGVPGMVCKMIILILLFLPVVSCRKSSSLPASTGYLESIASKLDGIILTGPLSTGANAEGITLLCKNGKILIGLQKIPLQEIADPGNIKHAAIIYSDSGIVILDTETNQCWYYIQNDEKSQKQFKALQSAGKNSTYSDIAGTVKINLS